MQAEESQTNPIQILTAAYRTDSGPGGIGLVVRNAAPTAVGQVYEQSYGSIEELQFRAVLRALQLGKKLRANRICVLCPDESVVKQVNREVPVAAEGTLPLLYMQIKALVYTYRQAEVIAVSKSKVRAARRLAVAASKIPVRRKAAPRTLFDLDQTAAKA